MVAVMVRTVMVSVVHEGKGAVEDPTAWMANCNSWSSVLWWQDTLALLTNMHKFFLACLFNANITSPHSLCESVLLIAVMRYCEDGVLVCMVLKQ